MGNKKMKLKIYKTIFTILILVAIIVLVLIVIKYKDRYQNEIENQQTLEVFSQINLQEENTKIEMNGYEVIGTVKIPKIGIEYPILGIETINPDETKEPMKFAIVRYWGGKVNEYGNLSIAGHNNYDGTMFGKTKKLEIGDVIELTDLNKTTISYKIYNIFITNPDDVSILKSEDNTIREVTLITCTNGNKERLILKAKQVD